MQKNKIPFNAGFFFLLTDVNVYQNKLNSWLNIQIFLFV